MITPILYVGMGVTLYTFNIILYDIMYNVNNKKEEV